MVFPQHPRWIKESVWVDQLWVFFMTEPSTTRGTARLRSCASTSLKQPASLTLKSWRNGSTGASSRIPTGTVQAEWNGPTAQGSRLIWFHFYSPSEFMVEEHELQKEKIQEDYNDKYWDQRYTIVQHRIPSFLQKMADKILSTGKSQKEGSRRGGGLTQEL